ncbi:GbsR/MarR family transcriptional regulator [Kitasatospora sp. NPDC006697]|uniref:GbsR/MarR family transcriptional regulator n=1 Tax=Kitasatospora sp. NPDC006697 TaxID=3364020 RepID=UPI00368C83D3
MEPAEHLSNTARGGKDAPGAGRDEEAVVRFTERFAVHLSDVGFPRMPARIFAGLITAEHDRPTAAELAALLRVSPSAVSVALRYLIQLGLVARGREPGERRDHYRILDDLWYEAFTHRDTTLARWEEGLREGLTAVGPQTPAGMRLTETLDFFGYLRTELHRLIGKWRDTRGEPAAAALPEQATPGDTVHRLHC